MKKLSWLFYSVAVLLSFGCKEHTTSDSYNFSESISRVDISLDSADVKVVGTEDDGASVDFKVRYHGSEPSITVETDNGTLRIRMSCHLSCDGDFAVTVPSTVTSVIRVDSGNMEIDGLLGDSSLNVDSGNVRLNGSTGRLSVSADSGNVTGTVTSTVVDGSVDSGNLDLRFDIPPSDLDLSADSGNITLEVPNGAYDVHTKVDSGQVSVRNITVEDNALGVIWADVDSGNITIVGY